MKSIVVVSDSHNNRAAFDKLDQVFAECDYIFHLGDVSADGGALKNKYGDKVFIINGNCDPFKLGEDEIVTSIEGVNIFATHGHLYGVKSSLSRLCYRAQELQCTLALYGHTHDARVDEMGDVTMINPGTLSRFSAHSYCYITIHQSKIVYKIVNL